MGDLWHAGQRDEALPVEGDGLRSLTKPAVANYRGLELAEMGRAMLDQRPHRADGALALQALAVMTSILDAATEGRKIKVQESCERPRRWLQPKLETCSGLEAEPRDFG